MRGCPPLALTALAQALMLPLDPLGLWPRPEPFLLLAVAGGLWAATRRAWWGPILLGFFIGFAADIKVYHVLPSFPWRSSPSAAGGIWKSLALGAVAAVVSVATFFAPFASPAISLGNYVAMLRMMDAGRRFIDGLAVANFEWAVVLSLIALAPLLIEKRSDTQALLWKNVDLLGALVLSALTGGQPSSRAGRHPARINYCLSSRFSFFSPQR